MNNHYSIDLEKNKNFSLLTNRQKQVLYHTIIGKYSKEIAKELGLSYRTVQHYMENIKEKLNVSSRSKLIKKVLG